jgi:3-deoxy-D-manno-octulosonic-acid transferase
VQILYNLLTYILLLPYAGYWFVRGIINRTYWHKFPQRLGIDYPKLERCIWVHAVSVGEVVAAVPLIRALLARYPDRPLLVTTVTPTGAARVAAIFGDDVYHAYIPFEMPQAVDNFFASVNPELALVLETEIWPNLYRGCGVRDIPLVLVSARISPKSVRSYRRLLPLFRETLSHGIIIAAQTEADAERFLSLGAAPERTRVTGNIKFENGAATFARTCSVIVPSGLLPAHMTAKRPSCSRHIRGCWSEYPGCCSSWCPGTRSDLPRSGTSSTNRGWRSWRGQTRGIARRRLPCFSATPWAAFVGGSLVPIGGHNLLEPAALGLPLVSGPHVFNAQEIAAMFIEKGACCIADDAEQLTGVVEDLLSDYDKAKERGELGRRILERNRGALQRLLAMIEPLLA